MSIPASMKAIQIIDDGQRSLRVNEIPTPQPKPGEVLIKVAASPINPSDLGMVRGTSYQRTLPAIPGLEGGGVVVAAGSGLIARMRMGKTVGFSPRSDYGAWAEYTIAPAMQCFPAYKGVSAEQASMSIVNPVTAWALIEKARKAGSKGVVNTAAGSVLGRMIWRLGRRHGMTVLNVVRRDAQVEQLAAEGRQHVLNSETPDFVTQLSDHCHRHDIRFALDAVAGEMTGVLSEALPEAGHVTIYGRLSGQASRLNLDSLGMRGIVVDGFHLMRWFKHVSRLTLLRAFRQVPRLIANELHSPIRARFGLEQVEEAIQTYSEQMSGGKVLIVP